ncbi:inactive rhomboid protein 1 isoform X2 [Ixodes scapularis]
MVGECFFLRHLDSDSPDARLSLGTSPVLPKDKAGKGDGKVKTGPLESPGIGGKRLRFPPTRSFFNEEYCYIMDAKNCGNIGRYLNDQYMRSRDWHLSHLQPLRAEDAQDSVVRRSASAREVPPEPFHRDPVYKMTWDGLTFLTTEVRKRMSSGAQLTRRGSRRSFMPSVDDSALPEPDDTLLESQAPTSDELVDDVFFAKTPSATPSVAGDGRPPAWPPAPASAYEVPRQQAPAGRRRPESVWRRPASVHVDEEEDMVDGRLGVGMTRIGDKVRPSSGRAFFPTLDEQARATLPSSPIHALAFA